MSTDRPTAVFDIDDAKVGLSDIIERVERGAEIVISREGTPVAKVVPFQPRTRRTARRSLAVRIDLSGDRDSAETNATITRGLDPAT